LTADRRRRGSFFSAQISPPRGFGFCPFPGFTVVEVVPGHHRRTDLISSSFSLRRRTVLPLSSARIFLPWTCISPPLRIRVELPTYLRHPEGLPTRSLLRRSCIAMFPPANPFPLQGQNDFSPLPFLKSCLPTLSVILLCLPSAWTCALGAPSGGIPNRASPTKMNVIPFPPPSSTTPSSGTSSPSLQR